MFRLSTLSPAEPKGTIRVRNPIRSLGACTDVDGQEWDIRAITSGGVAACRRHALHPYFTDTSSGGGWGARGTTGSNFVSQDWDAYAVEVVP